MNYRHIYHAGNICDVVKHAVLTLLLRHLRAKDTAFSVLDTHAGIGRYDLDNESAQKTGEAEAGIRKLWDSARHKQLTDYLDIVRETNPNGMLRFYPGSPLIIRKMLRPHDRLTACELHPEDAQSLKRYFHHDKQVHVHNRDGYEAIPALLPPKEKRGLVFIDPPFESGDEFSRLVEAIITINRRWPQGQAAIWYPIKERPTIWRFHEALANSGVSDILCAEFIHDDESRSDRLNGCGFVFLAPPWRFDTQLAELLPLLHEALGTATSNQRITWITERT